MAVMNFIQVNNNTNTNRTDCGITTAAIIMFDRMQPIVDRRAHNRRRINASFATWPALIYRMSIRRSKLMGTANQLPRKVGANLQLNLSNHAAYGISDSKQHSESLNLKFDISVRKVMYRSSQQEGKVLILFTAISHASVCYRKWLICEIATSRTNISNIRPSDWLLSSTPPTVWHEERSLLIWYSENWISHITFGLAYQMQYMTNQLSPFLCRALVTLCNCARLSHSFMCLG